MVGGRAGLLGVLSQVIGNLLEFNFPENSNFFTWGGGARKSKVENRRYHRVLGVCVDRAVFWLVFSPVCITPVDTLI